MEGPDHSPQDMLALQDLKVNNDPIPKDTHFVAPWRVARHLASETPQRKPCATYAEKDPVFGWVAVDAPSYERNPVEAVEPPEPPSEPEPSEPEPAPDALADDVRAALADGHKAALCDALAAVGLDADDYSNNDERAEALAAWLEE